MRITNNGYLRLAGAGIQFNGDTADANSLDDYEEGTYTPTFTNGTFTYNNQKGRYTKIGNLVTVNILISWTAVSGTGDVGVSLPFTSINDTYFRACGALGYISGVDNNSNRQLTSTLSGNSTVIYLYIISDNVSPTTTLVQNLSAAGEIQITTSYQV